MHPNAGPNGSGNNHPLHNETEVLLFPVGGDPDRKIIAGSLYNSKFPDIVNNANSSQSIMRTAGGNQIVQEDTDGAQYMSLYSPKYKSHVTMGEFHSVNPDMGAGITLGTEESISLTAGKSVNIASGMAVFGDGASQATGLISTVQSIIGVAGSVCAAASGLAAASVAGGVAKSIPSLVADVAGMAAGIAGSVGHTNTYISSPTKVAILGGGDVLLGANASIDMCALGVTNVLSGLETLVGSAVSVSIVAGAKDVEMLSILGDVKIAAQRVGNVEMEAKQKVTIKADKNEMLLKTETESITLHAKKNLFFEAVDENATLTAMKDVLVTSTDSKKIQLVSGNGVFTMTDEKLESKVEGEWYLTLDKGKGIILAKGSPDGYPQVILNDKLAAVSWDKNNRFRVNSKNTLMKASGSSVNVAKSKILITSSKVEINGDSLTVG
jgi:uncharacterized protein (DUF2345 family)